MLQCKPLPLFFVCVLYAACSWCTDGYEPLNRAREQYASNVEVCSERRSRVLHQPGSCQDAHEFAESLASMPPDVWDLGLEDRNKFFSDAYKHLDFAIQVFFPNLCILLSFLFLFLCVRGARCCVWWHLFAPHTMMKAQSVAVSKKTA